MNKINRIIVLIIFINLIFIKGVFAVDDLLKGIDPALMQKDVHQMTVEELLTIYKLPGADDFAGPELGSRGKEAWDKMADMALKKETSIEDKEVIIQVLGMYFANSDTLTLLKEIKKNIASEESAKPILSSIDYWESVIENKN